MVATSGSRLISEDATDALMTRLLPLADIITPNLAEAEVLTGMKMTTREEMEKAAKVLSDKLPSTVGIVIKGGHLDDTADDLLYVGGENYWINGKRIELVGIENAVKLYDPILTCTVIVNDKTNKILAFYTSEIEVDEQKLRASLGKSLQDYMIPSEFVRLDEIPLTFNGKPDRKKLKQMIPQISKHEKTEEIQYIMRVLMYEIL